MAYMETTIGRKMASTSGTSADSLLSLGLACCLGREVPKNLISAHMWFNLAAMQGSEAAKQYRIDISREMTAGDIAEAQKQARAWLQTH